MKYRVLLAIYLFALMAITLLPSSFSPEYMEGATVFRYNFVPFQAGIRTSFDSPYSSFFTIGNLLMLAPLGFMAPVLFKKIKNWKNIFFLGAGTAVFIEGMQLLLCLFVYPAYRYPDIDDVILNTLGIFIGYWVYGKFQRNHPK